MSNDDPIYSTFFGAIGAASAVIFCAFGSAYATAKAGASVATAGTRNPEAILRTLLPVVMAGIICIYGLVASVLIVNSITDAARGYTAYSGYLHFGSGISVGLTGLFAGYAVGNVGSSSIITTVLQPNYFVGMVLLLIFAEVIGLYGLILGLVLITK